MIWRVRSLTTRRTNLLLGLDGIIIFDYECHNLILELRWRFLFSNFGFVGWIMSQVKSRIPCLEFKKWSSSRVEKGCPILRLGRFLVLNLCDVIISNNENYGRVWIPLILLKIENWKYCSKIIFKCVNNAMRPIFNESFVKKRGLWVPWTVHETH